MSDITFEGNPVSVSGNFPSAGQQAPSFTLCTKDLSDLTLDELSGKKVVLNIFPSVDTPVCANSIRQFNKQAAELNNTVVVCVSADLPFSTSRFFASETIDNENIVAASFFRNTDFTESYGVNLDQGALKGLAARAVIVLNEEGLVTHSELVSELTNEPNYDAALRAL